MNPRINNNSCHTIKHTNSNINMVFSNKISTNLQTKLKQEWEKQTKWNKINT
jgi:hypothetical protein